MSQPDLDGSPSPDGAPSGDDDPPRDGHADNDGADAVESRRERTGDTEADDYPPDEGQVEVVAPPVDPLLAALARTPPLPKLDGSGPIDAAPCPEELQSLGYLMQHLPSYYAPTDRDTILRAHVLGSYAHRGQQRQSGEPYVLHPLAVTTILAELRMDPECLAAGLLHDVAEDSEFEIDYIRAHFGPSIAKLVDGVTKLKRINEIGNTQHSANDAKAESMRKMILAMVDDYRVVIIKLADRLHNMRTLASQPKHKRKRIARETLDYFAPLANRLGIWQVKWELEDISFRHLEPGIYRDLSKAVQQKQDERDKWVAKVKYEVEQALRKAGIEAEVSGRPKHIYSTYRKMQRKDVDFDQIYDVHGFRILVNSVSDCYAALGVVHSLWRPIPGEFDDYIANPKDNMYRSLHTAVLSRNGKPMEVQIRTQEMHDLAEHGIAAHWSYKEKTPNDQVFNEKIKWLRQIMEWRQDVTDAAEFVDGMKSDVFSDRVYVFTPQGDVIDLPAGSTPIDFAYAIHTELGHQCRGANIKGRLVPLDYKLQTGDQVEIITTKRGGPSRDWLNPNLEYVVTQRARSKIRTWLRKQDRGENVQRGRQLLEKELKRLSITDSFESVAKLFNFEKVDDFLAAIGYGEVNTQQIARRLLENERKQQEKLLGDQLPATSGGQRRTSSDGFQVQGVDGLLTHLGRCCSPVPGDPIVGYVTKGRGVTVHRVSCPNVKNMVSRSRDNRFLDVQWAAKPEETYPVRIQVRAYDRSGLMRDVASLVADERINMLSVEALTGQKDNLAIINATLEIGDVAQLTRILTKIERLPNVVEVVRRVG